MMDKIKCSGYFGYIWFATQNAIGYDLHKEIPLLEEVGM